LEQMASVLVASLMYNSIDIVLVGCGLTICSDACFSGSLAGSVNAQLCGKWLLKRYPPLICSCCSNIGTWTALFVSFWLFGC
jgi:hypothetical protein